MNQTDNYQWLCLEPSALKISLKEKDKLTYKTRVLQCKMELRKCFGLLAFQEVGVVYFFYKKEVFYIGTVMASSSVVGIYYKIISFYQCGIVNEKCSLDTFFSFWVSKHPNQVQVCCKINNKRKKLMVRITEILPTHQFQNRTTLVMEGLPKTQLTVLKNLQGWTLTFAKHS